MSDFRLKNKKKQKNGFKPLFHILGLADYKIGKLSTEIE
jgi:hypothetical protein